jgi:Leucine-rich repeat (LRR) protein
LEHLWLANCKLEGEIPFDIGHLVELRDLILCENKLTGQIPSEIGVMSKLDRLILSMNDLKGKIPISLGQCKNLSLLYLDRNHLTGQLPVEIAMLTQLQEMWLYCTNITVDGIAISECGSFLKSKFKHTEIVVNQPKTPTRVLVRKEIPHKEATVI